MKTYIKKVKQLCNFTAKNIVEIGSRDGMDAFELGTAFNISSRDVHLFDPGTIAAKNIKNNFAHFNFYNMGVGPVSGFFSFRENSTPESKDGDGMSSFLKREPEEGEQLIETFKSVQVITGEELFKLIGEVSIDLCKIDVEGLTYEVLDSFGREIRYIKTLHIECEHKEYWKGQRLYAKIHQLLTSFAFIEVYKIMAATYFLCQTDNIYIHKSAFKDECLPAYII